jgi:hypothetical protein
MLRILLAGLTVLALQSTASPQLTAQLPANNWDRGIQPISQDTYYKAIECGKQGGDNPPCVFYDTGLCKNEDFDLALFTPYKFVAYEVWTAVKQKKEAPMPSYPTAQRTRVTLGVTPVRGSKNQITSVVIKRGGKTIDPVSHSFDGPKASFTFDFPAWAPTAPISIEMIGKAATRSCLVSRVMLGRLR